MIHYTQLEQVLQNLETQVSSTHGTFPSHFEVRNNGKSKVQGFTLDDSTAGQNLPVVVAVGANYTQDKVSTPRDVHGIGGVSAKLKSCRTWLDRGFASYKSDPVLWTRRCAAQSPHLGVPMQSRYLGVPMQSRYHLVMTNFCLWITKRSWSEIQAQVRADLLQNNACFRGIPSVSPAWPHLEALANALAEWSPLWVGHGCRTEVSAIFRQFIDAKMSSPWILMPNLAFHYNYPSWDFLKESGGDN